MSIEDDAKRAKEFFDALDSEFSRIGLASDDWCNGGINLVEIAVHEKRLGISLPDEYKASLTLFNGFNEARLDLRHSGECFTGFHLSPLEVWGGEEDTQLIKEFFYDSKTGQLQQDWLKLPTTVNGPAKAMIHHPKWIAITMPSAWYSWYADFAPEPGGKMGQIVLVKSDPESVHVEVVASDFFGFMEILIDSVKAEEGSDW